MTAFVMRQVWEVYGVLLSSKVSRRLIFYQRLGRSTFRLSARVLRSTQYVLRME